MVQVGEHDPVHRNLTGEDTQNATAEYFQLAFSLQHYSSGDWHRKNIEDIRPYREYKQAMVGPIGLDKSGNSRNSNKQAESAIDLLRGERGELVEDVW